jgi:hypothetical protein
VLPGGAASGGTDVNDLRALRWSGRRGDLRPEDAIDRLDEVMVSARGPRWLLQSIELGLGPFPYFREFRIHTSY